MPQQVKPLILIDSREKENYRWNFIESKIFAGSKITKLENGDVSLENLENLIYIDRKNNFVEIIHNLFSKVDRDRFHGCLERIKNYRYKYIIVEANLSDIFYQKIPGLSIKPEAVMKKLCEISIIYAVHIIYAGKFGKTYCYSLLKRILEIEKYNNKQKELIDS